MGTSVKSVTEAFLKKNYKVNFFFIKKKKMGQNILCARCRDVCFKKISKAAQSLGWLSQVAHCLRWRLDYVYQVQDQK